MPHGFLCADNRGYPIFPLCPGWEDRSRRPSVLRTPALFRYRL